MPKKKLTPEERAIQRREKREAKKLRKEQKRRLIKHSEVQREMKYTSLTVKRHEASWKKLLLKISEPKMQEIVIYEWQSFERLMDVKDFTISLYMDEIDIAEVQYIRSMTEHVEGIDNHLKRYKESLEDMQQSYINDVTEMRSYATYEANLMNQQYGVDEIMFKTALFGLLKIRKDREKSIKGEQITKNDEENSRLGEILMFMRNNLENKFTSILEECVSCLSQYQKQTFDKKQEYIRCFNQDLNLKKHTKVNGKKIMIMHSRLMHMKDWFERQQKNKGQTIYELEMHKKYLKQSYQELRLIMLQQNVKIEKTMRTMTIAFNLLLEELKKFEKTGENILNMIMVCSKLQTAEEKVFELPFTYPCLDKKAEKRFIKEFGEPQTSILDTFWTKVSKSHIDKESLVEEKKTLKMENRLLKHKISVYCQCLSCPKLPPIQREVRNSIDARDVFFKYSQQFN